MDLNDAIVLSALYNLPECVGTYQEIYQEIQKHSGISEDEISKSLSLLIYFELIERRLSLYFPTTKGILVASKLHERY